MSSVQHRALSGSISNVAGIGSLFLQNIVIVPVMLHRWGGELYGVWIAINAVQSLIQTIDTGKENYLGNEFNRLYHTDRPRLERLLSTGLCSILILGPLQVLLVLALRSGSMLGRLLGINLNPAAQNSVWLALLALVVGWILSGSVGGLVIRLTYAVGYYARFNWWGVLQRVLLIVGMVVAVERGAGLVAVSVIFGSIQIVTNAAMMVDMFFILRRFGIRLRAPSLSLAVSAFGKSLLLTGASLLDNASTSGLFTLVAALFSAAVLPMFSTLRTLANVAMQCVTTIMNPLFPEMSRYNARNEIDKLNEMTSVCWLVTGPLVNAGLLCSILFVEPLYALWTHGKLPFQRDLFLLLALGVCLKSIGSPWYNYLICTNSIKGQWWVTFMRGAIVLGATYALATSAGLRSAGIAVVSAELVASLLLPLFFTQREFQRRGYSIPWRSFWLAFSSVLTVAASFAVFAARLTSPEVPVALGMAAIGLLAIAQWRTLSEETRARLISLVTRERKGAALPAV